MLLAEFAPEGFLGDLAGAFVSEPNAQRNDHEHNRKQRQDWLEWGEPGDRTCCAQGDQYQLIADRAPDGEKGNQGARGPELGGSVAACFWCVDFWSGTLA